ncbi:MAG: AAA family ATPase [Sulfurimonas sp.]|nr:AAA family ATPase [Sulfurimonas sp.]
MSTTNKLIIAGAGTGKTTFLVDEALKTSEEVLITTFTEANEKEIRKKFIEINNFIPNNVTIKTWFSMLIQHGVKPYQSYLFDKTTTGLLLVDKQSGLKYNGGKFPVYYKEEETEKHYFSKSYKIYSDKLSKFVIKCNEKSENAVFDRIDNIYNYIFIDEVQDLAGYDLEIIQQFFKISSNVILVGDPRQTTYKTHHERLNAKYKDGKIKNYLEDKCKKIDYIIDEDTLNCTYRNNKLICDFSLKLYPEYKILESKQKESKEHLGIYFIKKKDVDKYLELYESIQLRDSRKTKINTNFNAMNIGESKGLGFDRVLIYPTKPFINWIINNDFDLKHASRSKLYVAITRARYSVGIIYDYTDDTNVDNIENWRDNAN